MLTARSVAHDLVKLEGGSNQDASDVEVAVGETLSNAYRHAYGKGVGPVSVEIAFDTPRLTLTVIDEGKGLAHLPRVPGILSTQLGNVSRGMYLIGKLMDEVEFRHPLDADRGGVAVMMAKDLH